MVYLEEFGFKIYKLRDAKTEGEFLIYNIDKKNYSCYSENRAYKYLLLEFKQKNINLRKFGIETLGLEYKHADPLKLIIGWAIEEISLLDNIGYKPTKELIYEKHNKLYFNTFIAPNSFDVSLYKLDKPMEFEEFKVKCPYHYKLFYNLHNKDDLGIKDTLLKISDKIKYPYEKAQDCIIFYPGEGAGKGIFYKYVLQPIFQQYASKILMKKLVSDFNAYLMKPLVLVLEEGKRDLQLVETLKEVITEGSMLINEKGVSQREEEIYFLTFVFSNQMNPIDLGKRRGSYHLTHSLGKNIDESQKIGKELCDNLLNETEDLLKYLHNLEFEHQNALKPFNTKAKEQVADLNKNPLELFYDQIITYESIEKAFIDLNNRKNNNFYSTDFEFVLETSKDYDDIDKIYICKDLFKEAYNNFCLSEGFKSNLIRHNKDMVQLWALFKLPEESHKRIVVKNGKNEGRKLDHLRLEDIKKHYDEVKNNG